MESFTHGASGRLCFCSQLSLYLSWISGSCFMTGGGAPSFLDNRPHLQCKLNSLKSIWMGVPTEAQSMRGISISATMSLAFTCYPGLPPWLPMPGWQHVNQTLLNSSVLKLTFKNRKFPIFLYFISLVFPFQFILGHFLIIFQAEPFIQNL